jgi:1,2-phenylacetyl-CoA epoxidase catalytic subunit
MSVADVMFESSDGYTTGSTYTTQVQIYYTSVKNNLKSKFLHEVNESLKYIGVYLPSASIDSCHEFLR